MATIPDLESRLTPDLRDKALAMKAHRGLPTLGFYEELMAYPDLFQRIEALGTYVRFQSVLPDRIREAAILMAAVEQKSAFEWQTHVETARAAGVEPALFEAIAAGAPLATFGDALEDVRAVVRCVVGQVSVPQAVFDRLMAALGVSSAVQVVTLAAMYRMFASLAAAFDSEMPGAAPPPWENAAGA